MLAESLFGYNVIQHKIFLIKLTTEPATLLDSLISGEYVTCNPDLDEVSLLIDTTRWGKFN